MWVANCKQLMALTGDIPLGFYETPVPQVRSALTSPTFVRNCMPSLWT